MKKFFVSKNDKSKNEFIQNAIKEIKPKNVYILCEKERQDVYNSINALILPLKELNKSENWIEFAKRVTKDSLLVIDNVLKFVFFGDGKKKYLKDISQSIDNIIVTDIVPFYTEPAEIFYPFWFLGKEILGYSSYNSFAANHFEEKADGTIGYAHSFNVLKEKIQDYYVQDYDNFFKNVEFEYFDLTSQEEDNYNSAKTKHSTDFTNPIKMYREVSAYINEITSRYDKITHCVNKITTICNNPKIAISFNFLGYTSRYKKLFPNVDIISVNDTDKCILEYDYIIISMLPIVKQHELLYCIKENTKFIQIKLNNNKLETYFFDKIYNNNTRIKFDELWKSH